LLEHQVKFRLKGMNKAKVGLRLAVIHMLDQQFEKALSTIKISRWRNLPDGLSTERRHLEARILAKLDKPEEALKVLVGDITEEASLIRVDLHWQMRGWQAVIQTQADILGDVWNSSDALTEAQRKYVMRMAVGMALDGNEVGLDQLRSDYVAKMVGTPDAEGFDVITKKVDKESTQFRKVAGAIAQIDTLETLMTRYRDKLKGDNLVKAN